MGKGRRASVNSLTAFMDGLNVNAEPEQHKKNPPKKDTTDLLLGNLKKLNLTGNKPFKQPRKSGTKKSGTKKPEYSRMDVEKAKQVFRRRTRKLSARNADETLSSALDKLGLGTKKKRKRRRSKSKKKKRRKRRSKTKRN